MTDRVARTLLIGLLIVWAGLSRARLRDWESDTRVWASAVRVAPTLRARTNFASALIETNHWEAAIPWIKSIQTGSDTRGRWLADALISRAASLGYPVCDDSDFAERCR